MYSAVKSLGLSGLGGFAVSVEADISNGLPAFETVGLPDAAVRESRERVRSAIKNAGYPFPAARITVNLSPAGRRKEGSNYDLPIAVALLAASGLLPADALTLPVILGELALDGAVRPITGVLPMVIEARGRGEHVFCVPEENAEEAASITGVTVYPVKTLSALIRHLSGAERIEPLSALRWSGAEQAYTSDFADIKGQQGAKRAAEVAVAGGHNMLLVGTPGSGKTMLARSLPSILPELTYEEALEITMIHSAAGKVRGGGIIRERPFRAPHHGASAAALIGGGSRALPGEISLAHLGVLFLDELPEHQRSVLEALRQPLEDGTVTVSRAAATETYPAKFMLVAAMNPCPCGNLGSRTNPCRCTQSAIDRYRSRISGPLMDRIDIQIEMPEVRYQELTEKSTGEASSAIRERVNEARNRQRARFENDGIYMNAQMNTALTKKYCAPEGASEKLLSQAFTRLHLSARAYQRILKVARTVADLSGSEKILPEHYAEAIQYRSLDADGRD